jgi:hypothetical protein
VSDLSPEEQELLSLIRKEWGPTDETKDAVRAALPDALRAAPDLGPDAPPPGPTPSPSPSPSPAQPGLGNGLSRGTWAGAALAVIGVAVGVVWLRGSNPAPAPVPARDVPRASTAVAVPAPVAAHAATTQESETVSLDSLPNAPSQSPSAPRASAQPASAAPAASGDTLAEELALLRTAQNALRSGATDDALTALSTHATRFPHGVLREERMTLQVLALCDRGDVTAARAAKADLEKLAPGSSHLQRLASSCAAR